MTRLADQRIWVVGGAVAALLIVAVGWVGFAGPTFQKVGQVRDATVATRAENDDLMTATAVLRSKSGRLDRYTASLRNALAALPYDSGLPAFTRQLNAQGRAEGVSVGSVVVSGASPVEAARGGSAGVFAMQVTVQSKGSLTDQLAFLRSIQRVGPRRVLVTAAQVSPGSGSAGSSIERVATISTQLTVFSAPRPPAQVRQVENLLRGDLER